MAKVIVDFMVTPGRRITALRPMDQSVFIDPTLTRKKLASNSISPDRINNRGRGRLVGKAFEDAIVLVNNYEGLSKPGEYGSICLSHPLDFIVD